MEMMTHALHDEEYRTDRTGMVWETEYQGISIDRTDRAGGYGLDRQVQGLDFQTYPFTFYCPKPSITASFLGPNTYRQEESFF